MTVRLSPGHKFREQAGSLMLVGWEGNELSEPLQIIEEFAPAGLIFFRRNYPPGGGPELATQLAALKERSLEVSGRPLIVALDNEGGLVKRLPPPHVQLPGAPEQARLSLPELKALAVRSGSELRALGFNLNLAPVLDLAVPGTVMADRSFGATPQEVIPRAKAFIEGFEEAGVFCCGKHFPGLGGARADPHETLPTVGLGQEEMGPHLGPFAELAGSCLGMVMTSHCLYPGLSLSDVSTFDPGLLAILRGRLGFKGLALSDDLEMGAVAKSLEQGNAALAAIGAGHDLALVCRKRRLVEATHLAIASALSDGKLTPDRLALSSSRLAAFLAQLAPASLAQDPRGQATT